MVGNDIVDLSISHIGKGRRRSRYLEKIFTKKEITIINHLGKDDIWVWLLWSAKESVYKITSRRENVIKYAPKSLRCINVTKKLETDYETQVEYNGELFTVFSQIKESYIHSIATTIDLDRVVSKVFKLMPNENESGAIDTKVLEWIGENSYSDIREVKILRDSLRVPHVYIKDEEAFLISISHHGAFGAFVLTSYEQ